MARTNEKTVEEIATESKAEAKAEAKVLPPHKCILIWREERMLRLYAGTDANDANVYLTIYPGVNTVDSDRVLDIYKSNQALFDKVSGSDNVLEFKGIKFKEVDGELTMTENYTLKKTTAKDLTKLINASVNPETLADLSSPDYTPFTGLADSRIAEIEQYQGYQAPDNSRLQDI